jgi:hypothetical protein
MQKLHYALQRAETARQTDRGMARKLTAPAAEAFSYSALDTILNRLSELWKLWLYFGSNSVPARSLSDPSEPVFRYLPRGALRFGQGMISGTRLKRAYKRF